MQKGHKNMMYSNQTVNFRQIDLKCEKPNEEKNLQNSYSSVGQWLTLLLYIQAHCYRVLLST